VTAFAVCHIIACSHRRLVLTISIMDYCLWHLEYFNFIYFFSVGVLASCYFRSAILCGSEKILFQNMSKHST
jgi:hypothetical protein